MIGWLRDGLTGLSEAGVQYAEIFQVLGFKTVPQKIDDLTV